MKHRQCDRDSQVIRGGAPGMSLQGPNYLELLLSLEMSSSCILKLSHTHTHTHTHAFPGQRFHNICTYFESVQNESPLIFPAPEVPTWFCLRRRPLMSPTSSCCHFFSLSPPPPDMINEEREGGRDFDSGTLPLGHSLGSGMSC